jgi:hypothetical protein
MQAFMSYQTDDRAVAALVSALLADVGVTSFMAHEHIEVSADWRIEILHQLRSADLFVPILSAKYYSSIWCKQESGIAAFRIMTIIPLSIDGSIPLGFLNHIQSTKIDRAAPTYQDVFPGLARHDVSFLIDGITKIISESRNYRAAELNFQMILPYTLRATDAQTAKLLTVSANNDQICNAALCAQTYLPPLFASHGHLLDATVKKKLADTLARYAKKTP